VQAHVPFAQDLPLLHAVLHVPQLAESLDVSTHAAEQFCSPSAQLAAHTPLEQTSPVGHCVPQLPQLLGLEARSTHCPSHEVCPLRQVDPASGPGIPASATDSELEFIQLRLQLAMSEAANNDTRHKPNALDILAAAIVDYSQVGLVSSSLLSRNSVFRRSGKSSFSLKIMPKSSSERAII